MCNLHRTNFREDPDSPRKAQAYDRFLEYNSKLNREKWSSDWNPPICFDCGATLVEDPVQMMELE